MNWRLGDRDWFIIISVWLSRIQIRFVWIRYDLYTDYLFTIFILNLLWILYNIPMLIVFTNNLLWLSRIDFGFVMKRLSLLRIHYISTMSMANSLWIHYLYRESTMDSFSVSRSDYESTLRCANSRFINYFFYKLTSNALTASWTHNV